jgi:hypothetical protein
MTGEQPVKRLRVFLAFVLSCCGYIFWISAPARADEADTKPAELIPQDEVIVQNRAAAESLPITYSLRIYKEPDRIKLKGNMSSEEDYKTLIGLIKANFPSVNLSDRVTVDEDAVDGDVKIGGLSFALKLLGYLETGQASVDDNGLSLEGSASTAVVLGEVKTLIEKDKPTGVPIKNIRIAPPEKSWHASVTDERTVKITGVVPSEEDRAQLLAFVRQKFSGYVIEDNTAINDKLDARWFQAALNSLELLALLDKGSVEVTEQTIHLVGSAASEMAMKSIDSKASSLPSGFALKSEVTAPAPYHGFAAIPAAGTFMRP